MEDTTSSEVTPLEPQGIDFDAELTEILEGKSPESTPPEPTPPAETAFDVKALDAIEEPKAEEPAKSTDFEKVLTEVAPLVEGYQTFTQAFEGGDFEGVEQMLEQFAPEAHKAFMSHLYAKYIDKWTDRWVEEKEGKRDPRVSVLHGEVEKLKQALADRTRREQSSETRAQLAQTARNYNTYLEGLFNRVNFSKADRRWVGAEINNQIAATPALVQAVRENKFGGVAKVFKNVLTEYVGKDKAAGAAVSSLRAAQAVKQPPIQSAPVVEMEGIPDNVDDVPKDKLDSWLDMQLAKLKRAGGRK